MKLATAFVALALGVASAQTYGWDRQTVGGQAMKGILEGSGGAERTCTEEELSRLRPPIQDYQCMTVEDAKVFRSALVTVLEQYGFGYADWEQTEYGLWLMAYFGDYVGNFGVDPDTNEVFAFGTPVE